MGIHQGNCLHKSYSWMDDERLQRVTSQLLHEFLLPVCQNHFAHHRRAAALHLCRYGESLSELFKRFARPSKHNTATKKVLPRLTARVTNLSRLDEGVLTQKRQ